MTTAETLTATVTVPMAKDDPSRVAFEEIPLPPRDMWGDATAPESAPTPASDPAPVLPAQAEVLAFIGGSHMRTVPLKHAFCWGDRLVDAVTVRRLTLGELEALLGRNANVSLIEVYALMAGLPVGVLRGLIDEDGDAVTDAAYDFLPRSLRTAGG